MITKETDHETNGGVFDSHSCTCWSCMVSGSRLWPRNDAEFKPPCRWSRGRTPTARRPMSRSTRTRATDKGNSKKVANKLKDLAPRTGAWPLFWRRRSQSTTSSRYICRTTSSLHQRLRLATEARAKASKALQVAKREEADIVELLALKRAEVDQFKATLLQHIKNSVELLELETGSAELCHVESPSVHTVTTPLSRVQWAARFSQLPQRRSAGRLRCLLQGATLLDPGLQLLCGNTA